ncbi:hypothetical protein YC2023_012498 [Brassica napus]
MAFGLLDDAFTTEWDEILALLTSSSWPKIVKLHDQRHEGSLSTPHKLISDIDKAMKNIFSSLKKLGDARFEKRLCSWLASRPSD